MINGPRNIYKSQLSSQRRIETVRKSPQAPVVNIFWCNKKLFFFAIAETLQREERSGISNGVGEYSLRKP